MRITDLRSVLLTGGSAAEAVDVEVTKLSAIRDHAGPNLRVLLDGHMGHREGVGRWDLQTARAMIGALEPYDLVFFEEPLPYADPGAWAELATSTAIPVAGGEQLASLDEFVQFHRVRRPDAPGLGVTLTDDIKHRFPFRPGAEEFSSVPGKIMRS